MVLQRGNEGREAATVEVNRTTSITNSRKSKDFGVGRQPTQHDSMRKGDGAPLKLTRYQLHGHHISSPKENVA